MPASYSVLHRTNSGAVKSGPGGVHSITLSAGGATATMTLYNNTAGSGTILWKLSSIQDDSNSVICDVPFGTGCYMALAGTGATGSISFW
jgi:hypothetical protein